MNFNKNYIQGSAFYGHCLNWRTNLLCYRKNRFYILGLIRSTLKGNRHISAVFEPLSIGNNISRPVSFRPEILHRYGNYYYSIHNIVVQWDMAASGGADKTNEVIRTFQLLVFCKQYILFLGWPSYFLRFPLKFSAIF